MAENIMHKKQTCSPQLILDSKPELDNQYKLKFTLFTIGRLGVHETQWLRSLVQRSIRAAQLW